MTPVSYFLLTHGKVWDFGLTTGLANKISETFGPKGANNQWLEKGVTTYPYSLTTASYLSGEYHRLKVQPIPNSIPHGRKLLHV